MGERTANARQDLCVRLPTLAGVDVVLGVAGLVALVAGLTLAAWAMRARTAMPVREASASEWIRTELAESEDERRDLRLVLDSMGEGVLLFDAEGRVRLANPAAEAFLGNRRARAGALFPLDLRRAVASAAEFGEQIVAEVEVGTPTRILQGTATRVDLDGSVLLVLLDVTEAKRLDAVRRDFVTNASHELKTPAASIQAAAETIATAAQDDGEAVPRFAEQLEREAARLSRIVSDLLDLSRLESGSELLDNVRLDVVLNDERERFERAAEHAGVTIVVHAERTAAVRGSARDVSLLVRNLVDNAIRYTKPGGTIDVGVRTDGDDAVLTVSDTGIGIPARELSRIFERFYRVDRARSRETGGTGLGLSIVKHVTENHGGTIEVRSQLGTGTTFEVRLPIAR
jgi:signal transduction histidine kinase